MNKFNDAVRKIIKTESKKKKILFLSLIMIAVVAVAFIIYIFISVNDVNALIKEKKITEAKEAFGYNFVSLEKKDAVEACYSMYSYLNSAQENEIDEMSTDTQKDWYFFFNIECLRNVVGYSEKYYTKTFKELWQNALNECMQNLMNAGYDEWKISRILENDIEENAKDEEYWGYYPYYYYSSITKTYTHTVDQLLDKVDVVLNKAEIDKEEVKMKTNPYQGLSIRYDKYEDGYIVGKIYNDSSYSDYKDVKLRVRVSSVKYNYDETIEKEIISKIKAGKSTSFSIPVGYCDDLEYDLRFVK